MEEEDISIEDLHADLAQKHSALARLYADVCAERDLLLLRVAALEETEAGVKRVRRAGGGDDDDLVAVKPAGFKRKSFFPLNERRRRHGAHRHQGRRGDHAPFNRNTILDQY